VLKAKSYKKIRCTIRSALLGSVRHRHMHTMLTPNEVLFVFQTPQQMEWTVRVLSLWWAWPPLRQCLLRSMINLQTGTRSSWPCV